MITTIYNIFGPKGAGKDTAGSILERLVLNDRFHVFKLSFAYELKKIIWSLFEYKIKNKEYIYGNNDDKNTPIKGFKISNKFKERYNNLKDVELWTGRFLMQTIGTEVMVDLDPYVWSNTVKKQIKGRPFSVIITDCRFKENMEVLTDLKDTNLINIKIEGRGDSTDTHLSESGYDKFTADHVINNTGGLDDLENQLQEILYARA